MTELGDVCAIHVVDNPDLESEVAMLRSYAPRVPEEVLHLLCELWADLRELVDKGELTYPYSLRELVRVAKYLEQNGEEEGVVNALR